MPIKAPFGYFWPRSWPYLLSGCFEPIGAPRDPGCRPPAQGRRSRTPQAPRPRGSARIHRLRPEQDAVPAHTLLTEQRHPKTWNLSSASQSDTAAGLRMLFSVDEDIARAPRGLASGTQAVDEAAGAVKRPSRPEEDLYLRLRRDGPAGQADGELVLAAFLEKGQGQDESLGEAPGACLPTSRSS